ncbi:MAG: DUF4595 domain-containing protein [Bacteroidales bacterium]|nr:DUF4595 domain-containing protein [Bacteroidales bacterium]
MRRILMTLLLVMAVACNETGSMSGLDVENPLSECVLPASVQAGGEVLVQWDGFPEAPAISVVGEDGTSYEMTVTVVTASGLIFTVPASLAPGIYMVKSGQDELGTIVVLPADMPVTGLKVSSGARQGEDVSIDGIGFEEGCEAVLVDDQENEYPLETVITYSGISVVIPDDLAEGSYKMYLVQDGMKWLLSGSFLVYKDVVIKTLTRVDYYSPYVSPMMLRLSWEISRDDPVTLTVSETVINGEEESLEAYDRYICDASGYFTLDHDGFEASNDMGMSYIRNADGVVTQADVLIYGDSEATPFTWTYDADGFLTDISSPKRSLRSFSYEGGNLVKFRNTSFEYSDPALINNPSAADVVWGYMSLMEKNDPFIYFPYLLGWYTKASAQLPSAMVSPSPTGTGTEIYALTYEFDAEGYVTRMSWNSDYVVYHYK